MDTPASDNQQNSADRAVYDKLAELYKEWNSLLILLGKERDDLRREFDRIVDKQKMEEVLGRIKTNQ
ncbi:MAG: hypothetical protein PHD72_01345 [Patescibacteria group bacterium]|nr:hypothetical protein [Patescibacteria group bacterium]